MASSMSPSLLLGSTILSAAVLLHHHDGAATTTTTHLHFYMHDDYTGALPSAMRVVSGRSLLHQVAATDVDGNDTMLPSSSSPPPPRARVGTAQGFGVRVSERGLVTDLSMHMVMEAGEHRGSSVAIKGRIDVDVGVRESVVVGGTGRFRLARGYMVSSSYDYSLAAGGVVEIDVYLQH
uniref:Dirigent protein n=1 Tax=Oryza punctata TaxID=4537 RepID=A0A0E0MDU6_ORYPU